MHLRKMCLSLSQNISVESGTFSLLFNGMHRIHSYPNHVNYTFDIPYRNRIRITRHNIKMNLNALVWAWSTHSLKWRNAVNGLIDIPADCTAQTIYYCLTHIPGLTSHFCHLQFNYTSGFSACYCIRSIWYIIHSILSWFYFSLNADRLTSERKKHFTSTHIKSCFHGFRINFHLNTKSISVCFAFQLVDLTKQNQLVSSIFYSLPLRKWLKLHQKREKINSKNCSVR